MDRPTVTQDLLSIWLKAVKDGRIVNEFETPDGQKIQFGLTLRDGEITYYAKNLASGCEIPAGVEEKTVDHSDFVIQFNGFRALRPGCKISSLGRQPDISAAAMDCRFSCQDPGRKLGILRRDPLAQLTLPNYKWNAYFNATPTEKEGHFLWLPVLTDGAMTTIPHFLQELSLILLEDVLALFRQSDKLMVLFNSLHAGASVNHIHLHAIYHKRILSIETARVVKRNGLTVFDNYPAHGAVFSREAEPDEIWPHLDRLQKKQVPFNLVCVGERVCLIPRNLEHEVVAEFPMGVIAVGELAGKFITVDKAAYDRVNYGMIQMAFQKTTVADF